MRHAEQQRTKHSKAGKPHRLGGDSAEEADTSWLREREEEPVTNDVVGYENFDKEEKSILCEIGALPHSCPNASNYLVKLLNK